MMILYDREASGNAYKIRLMLAFLALPYERIAVAMKNGVNEVDDDYRRLNPRGQIPTLQDGEVTLWSSTAILAYLASRYDASGQWLPQEPARLGAVMQWMELAQNEIQDGLFRARAIAHLGLAGNLEQAHAQAHRALAVLESRLANAGWLAGSQPTVADVACFPYVALAHQGQVDISAYPGVQHWVDRFKLLDRFVGMPGIK